MFHWPQMIALSSARSRGKATVNVAFDKIDRYEFVEHLGGGGMGEVWHVHDTTLDAPCALKIMRPEYAEHPGAREEFFKTATIAARLALHEPNIVRMLNKGVHVVHDKHGPLEYLWLAMDLVDGFDLRKFSRTYIRAYKSLLPISAVEHIIRCVLRTLHVAHTDPAGPVVHRDINPGNVLISSHGVVRVTDFGIARKATQQWTFHLSGTGPYMAPEQLRLEISHLSDLYAVGAMLHELLAGKPPIEAGLGLDKYLQAAASPALPPLDRPDIPPRLHRLRESLLQKNTADRIQDAEEALKLLSNADATPEIAAIYMALFGMPRTRTTVFDNRHASVLAPYEDPPSFLVLPAASPAEPSEQTFERPWSEDADVETQSKPAVKGRRVVAFDPELVQTPATMRLSGAFPIATPSPPTSAAPAQTERMTLEPFIARRTVPDQRQTTSPVTLPSVPVSERPRVRVPSRPIVLPTIAVVGLGLVAASASMLRRSWQAAPPSEPPRVEQLAEPPLRPESKPTPQQESASPPDSKQEPESASPPESKQEPESASSPDVAVTTQASTPLPAVPDPLPKAAEAKARRKSPRVTPPRVRVTFVSRQGISGELRVGRKTLPIAWIASTDLPLGIHRLAWRKAADDPWIEIGTLALEDKTMNYEVRLGRDDFSVFPRSNGGK
jgi:serine/threonine protein kinase